MHGALDDELHADGGGEMYDNAGLRHEPIEHDRIGDVGACEMEVGVTNKMLDVLNPPRGQVVDDEHAVSLVKQCVRKVGADKPRTAGDQDGERLTFGMGHDACVVRCARKSAHSWGTNDRIIT